MLGCSLLSVKGSSAHVMAWSQTTLPWTSSESRPSTAGESSQILQTVSCNSCRGLKYVSKDRHKRIAAIANAFSKSDHDIIALQELWVEEDYNKIRDATSHRLPYTKRFLRCVWNGCDHSTLTPSYQRCTRCWTGHVYKVAHYFYEHHTILSQR